MEPELERVRKQPRTTPKSRKPLAESSPLRISSSSSHNRSVQLPKKSTASKEEYPIKDITAEEIRAGGKLWYEIDWEGPYDKTWEPAVNVNEAAIRDWERKKKKRTNRNARKERKRVRDSTGGPPTYSPDSSQPIRPAKRERVSEAHVGDSTNKKPRRAGPGETAGFQSLSQEDALFVSPYRAPSEIKDSYEEELSSGGVYRNTPQVILRPPENFNPNDYQTVVSSQPSQLSQPSQPSENSQPSQPSQQSNPYQSIGDPATTSSQSQIQPRHQPRKKQYIWDEEIEVADSQELQGSSSYKPPETQASGTRPETATESDIQPFVSDLLTSSRDETGISSSGRQFAESSDYRPSTSNIVESQSISEDRSARETSTEIREETTQEHSLESYPAVNSSSSNVLGHSAPQNISSAHLELSAPQEIETSSGEPIDSSAVAGGPSLEETSGVTTQVESPPNRQPDLVDHLDIPSSFPSLTQFPLLESDDNVLGEEAVESVEARRTGSQNGLKTPTSPSPPLSFVGATQSQNSPGERPQRRLHSQTQESISSFEQAWQPARAISLPAQLAGADSLAGQVSSALGSAHTGFSQIQDTPPLERAASKQDPQTRPPAPRKHTAATPRPSQFESNLSESQGTVLTSIEQVLRSPHTPRRSPVSDSDMDAQSTPNQVMDPKKLMREMREARERASAMRHAESASREASTVPPSPLVAAPDHMLPLRENVTEPAIPLPMVEPASSPKVSADDESDGRALRILPLKANVYVVPLPLQSQTRDIYVQTVKNNKRQRLDFLPDGVSDPNLIKEIDLMMDELRALCSHPDLITENDFPSQREESEENQAKHAETISTKCIFVAEFIDAIRPSNQHIGILAQPGRIQEILEYVLRYHGFENGTGPNGPNIFRDASGGPLTIALRSTTEKYIDAQPTSAIVAFDSPLTAKAYAKSAGVLISLVVSDSIEHIELCVEDITNLEGKQTIVDYVSQLQEDIGKLDSDYPPPPEAAKLSAEFVMNMTQSSWPIPPMPEITGLEFRTPSQSQSQPRSEVLSGSTQSYDMQTQVPQSSGKRQFGLDDVVGSGSPKRQRLSPNPSSLAEQPPGNNFSPVGKTFLQPLPDKQGSKVAEAAETTSKALDDAQGFQVSSLLERIKEVEVRLQRKDASEAELRERNKRLEEQCKDLKAGLKAIEPKYREALNERGQFEYEINQVLQRESTLRKKYDGVVVELTKAREQKSVDDADLAAARSRLASSAIPEVAEMEQVAEYVRNVKSENERLVRRFESSKKDAEFAREQYQQASSAAGESARELAALKEHVQALKDKAHENTVRVHEIYNSSEVQQHLDKIKELEAEKTALELDLERKIDEVKILTSGRRGTRGASVPRSPRMGSASVMSPGPQRAIGRVIASGNRSRGTSPAPGEMQMRGGPSEALFQGPQSRWGTHLQG